MKFISRCVLALVLFLAPSLAYAAVEQCQNAYQKINRTLINNVALNAAAASRTFTINASEIAGYGIVAVYVKYTFGAATAVTMTCTATDTDAGTTYYTFQSCNVAGGVCTSTDASWSNAIAAASENWVWKVDMLGIGASKMRCVFAGTGAGAADLITVTGTAVAQ